jgi:hypothetical protein
MQSTVQSLLLIILPLLGLILPGILKQDKFSSQTNTAISIIVVALASGATAYAYDQFGPNLFRDAVLVFTGMEVLLQGKLKPLDAYLQSNAFTLAQQQLPMIEHAVAALVASTPLSSGGVHITAQTVHVTPGAVSVPTLPEPIVAPDVTPIADPVVTVQESSGAGAIVGDVTPVMTGITTAEEANQKTQKIAAIKVTTPIPQVQEIK